jgi:hypothetical protein
MNWLELLCRWLQGLLAPRRRPASSVTQLRCRVGRRIEGQLRRNPYCLWGDTAVVRAFRAPGGAAWARRRRWRVRWDSVLGLVVVTRKTAPMSYSKTKSLTSSATRGV